MSALLEVRGLSVDYGKVRALHEASLRVEAGRIATVIGPNGAGKSTLLNAIMGVLPAAAGEVLFEGRNRHGAIESRVAEGLCLVPEKRELFASMTVEDNLLLGGYVHLDWRGRGWTKARDEVFALFPRLAERRTQLAGTLSGGERQMLAIGRALMSRPRLLMLDEPSLGLAPLVVREIFHIIAGLRERGVAILLVEQNARAALQVADEAHVLENGRIGLSGPAATLMHDPRVVATYLGLGRPAA
ncbi:MULTISPECIES: ABC transporter ATP-binding protein [Ramlibacter]|uniref:ABC transporter ATP-binding protein n=1 Tax=Ramlibacter aquaticus TaxID=2780094 RepID=A0ABR9SE89_9BURK|nr:MULTISPECIES: ABC transporter ATP-binding protein [Ramlibacter]MBE7940595.1 ABC transporter ATP-binding protein [Ramlibacter aquaticus]